MGWHATRCALTCASSGSAERAEGYFAQLTVDHDVAWRSFGRFDQGVENAKTVEQLKCMRRGKNGVWPIFHEVSIDPFGLNDASGAAARFEHDGFDTTADQCPRTGKSGDAGANNDDRIQGELNLFIGRPPMKGASP